MIQFTVETEIARSPTEVFAYATAPTKLATWQTNTISAAAEDDQPMRVGTRLREVHRAPGGEQLASLVEVSEYEPGRVFALRMLEGLPRTHRTGTASSPRRSSVWRASAPGTASPPMTKTSAPCARGSASTASSASGLPWMS